MKPRAGNSQLSRHSHVTDAALPPRLEDKP